MGAQIPGVDSNYSLETQFESLVGKNMALDNWAYWETMCPTVSDDPFNNAFSHGQTPLITWAPGDSLSNIAAGHDDACIKAFADKLKTYGNTIIIRFGHEMNGDWYPWGQQPTDYVAAWRHIVTLFRGENATNVKWFWCPNVYFTWESGLWSINQYYPGDNYVDYVGADIYNAPHVIGKWASWHDLAADTYDDETALSTKPLIIGEVGSATVQDFINAGKSVPTGATKAGWISDFLGSNGLQSMPRIVGINWFQVNQDAPGGDGTGNFLANSDTVSLATFQAGISTSSDYYSSTF